MLAPMREFLEKYHRAFAEHLFLHLFDLNTAGIVKRTRDEVMAPIDIKPTIDAANEKLSR